MEKDIVIIGGGPGGYTAAIRAAQLGARVLLVEAENLGGTCLNKGCIPTKALYKNAQLINELNSAAEFGIKLDGYTIDITEIMQRKQRIVDRLKEGIAQLIKANSIEMVYGKASLVSKEKVKVIDSQGNESLINTKNIIIATGSVPLKPPITGINLPGVMTSDEILFSKEIPKSLVIIGGGVIGIEFAGIFNALGSQVTVVEFLPRILANMDSEISKKLVLALKKKGISIETDTKVIQISKDQESFRALTEGKKGENEIKTDAVLVSVGRTPNVEGLELDLLGVEHDRTGIKVDETYQTNVPGIYAIGDVIGGQMLAHIASEEGIAAVDNIMGLKGHLNYDAVPGCVFTFPEIAAVGLSEEDAKGKGIDYTSSKFLFGANGKALTIGEEEGFVKVLAEAETKRIIGVHIMGPHASDLIHEAALAVGYKMTADDISGIVHAHPTLSEAFMEAALGIENKAIHMLPKKPDRRN
ncbi:MAG TPA: dihydrolipoyl dehydrogenase [Anaerovoracaceae bacterium]|nr:dihydrolipoyl dehydrogenase [Anaerovoracaceae bacterium]